MTDIEKFIAEAVKGIQVASPEKIRQMEWERYIEPKVLNAGFEKRHAVEKSMPSKPLQAMNKLRSFLKGRGAIVALVGKRGVGKTSMAAQITIEIAWQDWRSVFDRADGKRSDVLCRRVLYRKCVAVVGRLKALYGDFGTIETERLEAIRDEYSNCDLLVIDELAEQTTDAKLKDGILTDILDRRYAAMRDSILISNETPAAFVKSTSESIISRLNEHGGIIPCVWESFRETP